MRRLAAVAGAALVAALVPAAGSAATPRIVTIADPASSIAPSHSFVAACDGMADTVAANQACDGAAIPDFNAARAKEGLGPIVLPDDFDRLSVRAQVLAITDVERVDRGLRPVDGLSRSINALARQGANSDADPDFPDPFGPGRVEANSNWANTNSALLGAFMWLYSDGPGSGNLDCTSAGDDGCWGHRHTMLTDYGNPVVMGAAVASKSLTEEIIGGDTADPVDVSPTWSDISGSLTYGVAPANITVTTDAGSSKRATVTATSAGWSGPLEVGFESGSPTWSVSPSECDLVAGGTCRFVVTFAPAALGRYPGVLTVSDGTTVKTVALSGTGIRPRVAVGVSARRLARGHRLKLHGLVTADPTNAALSHRTVALQRKRAGVKWRRIGTDTTGGRGKVSYRLHPTKTARYRLEVLGAGGSVAAKSAAVKVHITR